MKNYNRAHTKIQDIQLNSELSQSYKALAIDNILKEEGITFQEYTEYFDRLDKLSDIYLELETPFNPNK